MGLGDLNLEPSASPGGSQNGFQARSVVTGTRLTSCYLAALEARWIDRALTEQALLRRVDSTTGTELVGRKRGDFGGIAIPYFMPGSTRVREYRCHKAMMRIPIREGKGGKDRDVPLSPTLHEELRQHYRRLTRKPAVWLFRGGRYHASDDPISDKGGLACLPLGRRTRRYPQTVTCGN